MGKMVFGGLGSERLQSGNGGASVSDGVLWDADDDVDVTPATDGR